MGQCAIIPPSSSGRSDTDNFLVVHRSDRATRCILDPDEVDQMILHQAEQMTQQDVEQYMNESGDTEYSSVAGSLVDSSNDEDSLYFGRSQSQAMTSYTANDTDVTLLVSNLDRYAMTKSKSQREPRSAVLQGEYAREQEILHAGDDEDSDSSSSSRKKGRSRAKRWKKEMRRSRSESSSSSSSSRRSNHPNDDMSLNRNQGEMMEYVAAAGAPSRDFRRKLHRRMHLRNASFSSMGGASGPGGAYTVMFGQCCGDNLAYRTRMAQVETYTRVLELRMAAKLAGCYRNQYLKLFPDNPNGLSPFVRANAPSKRPDSTPTLASVSSDASSFSRDRSAIDFFAGVPSSPVNLAVDGSAFLDMAVTGSLGLVDRRKGRESPTPSALKQQQKSPEHYIVLLHRRSGIPLAICALKSLKGPPVVRIYTTKQRVFGQRHAATTDDLGIKWSSALPLYAWAEIVTEGEFPAPMRYDIYMSTGSDGRFEKEPSYEASHGTSGSPDISVVGRTESERDYKGCATISVREDDDNHEIYMALSISRGIDPALFICFAAITDEIMEKVMRSQCDLMQNIDLRRGTV